VTLVPAVTIDADDRRALRTVLSGQYDAHARLVARTLAERPGLRSGADRDALVPGLVAVRAYTTGSRRAVNMYLRSAGPDDGTSQELLARCVAYGLHRLPVAIGPVFAVQAAAGAGTTAGYRPGDELTEPGFVDASLAPGIPGGGVEYAIWSVSARRLDGLGTTGGAALFPPGARFSVLAVDQPGTGGEPARVLMREVTSRATRTQPAGPPDRLLTRLRAVSRTAEGAAPLDFPIGLDATGRRYAATTAAVPARTTTAHPAQHPARTTPREGKGS
jgi:hypothetical protein